MDPLGITSGHVSPLKQSRQSSDSSRYAVMKTYLDDIQGELWLIIWVIRHDDDGMGCSSWMLTYLI